MIPRERVVTLKPYSARKRKRWERSYKKRFRADTASESFQYKQRNADTINPRPLARDIKQAVDDDTPLMILNEIEASVFMMVLCAGNPISRDAPLESQYLAAFQRIHDFHAERILLTPEELSRFSALVKARRTVKEAVADYKLWRKGCAA